MESVASEVLEWIISNKGTVILTLFSMFFFPVCKGVYTLVTNSFFCIVPVYYLRKKVKPIRIAYIIKSFLPIVFIFLWFGIYYIVTFSYIRSWKFGHERFYGVAKIVFLFLLIATVVLYVLSLISFLVRRKKKNNCGKGRIRTIRVLALMVTILSLSVLSVPRILSIIMANEALILIPSIATIAVIALSYLVFIRGYCLKFKERVAIGNEVFQAVVAIFLSLILPVSIAIELLKSVGNILLALWYISITVERSKVLKRAEYRVVIRILTNITGVGTIETCERIKWSKDRYVSYKENGYTTYVPLDSVSSIRHELSIPKKKKRYGYVCLNTNKHYYDVKFEKNDCCILYDCDSLADCMKVTFQRTGDMVFKKEKRKNV